MFSKIINNINSKQNGFTINNSNINKAGLCIMTSGNVIGKGVKKG